jgi:hypothetical protein
MKTTDIDAEKWQALYKAVNEVIVIVGAWGSIDSRHPAFEALNSATAEIDGGVFDQEIAA